ncbi:ATP-binding protein [Sporolactobacillus sp. CQH2019]|uniref:sensor histidine kinase n=1 Tax=Sporolactobacillus sp. CQH2019 TaxID=3023512 RepID=UPI002368218B|nr:ATP-binding protein [Sporolactobacillus sp. CQH2019]MDD9150345.1 ATP-binding protein [Sporolactobacillus sp. CQH2019]
MMKKTVPILLLFIFVIVNLYCLGRVLTDYTLLRLLSQVSSIGYYYSLLFLGLVFVGTGLVCFLIKPDSVVTRHFFYLMYTSGLAISVSIASSIDVSPAKEIEVIASSFAPYFLMRFFEFFPSSTKPRFFQYIRKVAWLLATMINIVFFDTYPDRLSRSPELLQFIRTVVIANVCISLIACICLTYLHLKKNSSKIKNQLSILIASLIISFLPLIFLSLIPEILHLASVPFFFSLLSIVLFPITLAYLLTKQEIIDIKMSLKPIVFEILAVLFSLISVNGIFFLIYPRTPGSFYRLNGLMLAVLAVYNLIKKIIKPLVKKEWTSKEHDIEREKKIILQQILNGQHLTSCGRLIIRLIHQTVDINGACLIWKNNQTPRIIYKSGIFADGSLADECMQYLDHKRNEHRSETMNCHVFPLDGDQGNKGWMIIGQKTNATRLDRNERLLLEKIQSDAIELLTSTEALSGLDRELRETQNRSLSQEQFNRALLINSEEEKRKLSIYLHDEVLQNVILMANKVEAMHDEQMIEDKAYFEMKEIFMNGIYEIREMSRELHPFMVEDLGLEQSLQALKRKLQNNYNVVIQTAYDLSLKVISKRLAVQVYRMIKELLYNAIKHSSSPFVSLSLKSLDHTLIVNVKDKGKGFKLPAGLSSLTQENHIGLITVQKRVDQLGGRFDIASEEGKGTSVTITLPLERSDEFEYQRTAGR